MQTQSVSGFLRSAIALTTILFFMMSNRVVAADRVATDNAIRLAQDYLFKNKTDDGNWELIPARLPTGAGPFAGQNTRSGQFGGRTAMAVYALLCSGVSPTDPRLVPAIEFMKKTDYTGVYSGGFRLQALARLPMTDEVKSLIKRDYEMILNAVVSEGDGKGHFDYVTASGRKSYSHSRSQYGILGIWAAAQSGIEVRPQIWKLIEEAWIRNQDISGGWTYTSQADNSKKHAVTPGMTAAAVSSLFITADYTRNSEALCNGNPPNLPALDKGLQWLGDNMKNVAMNENFDRSFHFVSLYAVERVGLASGLAEIGGVDWFEKGRTWLLSRQRKEGSWSSGNSVTTEFGDTCFALMFLSRGTSPMAMAKLEYPSAQKPSWNQRPRDVANLARWIGKQVELELRWQIIPIDAGADRLLASPVVIMTGGGEIKLSDAQKITLKDYAKRGGLIVGNADCGSRPFAVSFKKLGEELFPGREFEELPVGHPIYRQQFPRESWKRKPGVSGISNGIRELMLLIPQSDPGKSWQTQNIDQLPESGELMANVLMYTVGRERLASRQWPLWETHAAESAAGKTIKVARLKHAGNFDPEPAGWARLNKIARATAKFGVEATQVDIGNDLIDYKIAHLTSVGKAGLTPEQTKALADFVKAGGLLIIDAAGGDSEFAGEIEGVLKTAFAAQNLKQLTPDAAIYKAASLGADSIRYRLATTKRIGASRTPRLQAIEIDGRVGVIYSREDLSAGLTGSTAASIDGYEPESAVKLMLGILIGSN